jgi:hypothetical protein
VNIEITCYSYSINLIFREHDSIIRCSVTELESAQSDHWKLRSTTFFSGSPSPLSLNHRDYDNAAELSKHQVKS